MGKDSNNNYKDFIKFHASEKRNIFKDLILVWVILLAVIIFTIVNPAFFTVANLFTIIRQASIVGLLALGLNIVVIIGGFDISIGAIANLAAVIMIAQLMVATPSIYFLWATGIAAGIVLSLINSAFIVYIGVPAFIVTLGMQSLATGLSRALTRGGITMYPKSLPEGFTFLGKSNIFGVVPVAVVIFLFFAAIIIILIEYTPFGRKLYAIGSNSEAANHVGIKVKKIKVIAFLISGALYGIGGVLLGSMFGSCNANMGGSFQMPAIIAVFLGAAFLSIGRPNIKGTIVSVFLLVVLVNGFAMANLPFFLRPVIQGLILLIAIGYQKFGKSKSLQ